MGITAKDKSNNNEGWGMGFLLVFFPEEDHESSIDMANNNTKKSSNLFSSSSPSSSTTTTFKSSVIKASPLRRSTSNHILSRAQSTISICALLFFTTFLIFTLSTFEPTTTRTTLSNRFNSRRHLSSNPSIKYKHNANSWSQFFSRSSNFKTQIAVSSNSHALQGLGILYSRGTKAMNDLVVGHISESVAPRDLRLFLRLLHRSGLTSKSDLVLIFPPSADSSAFGGVIREENESFLKLVKSNSTLRFDSTQFEKLGKKEKEWGEPIWGRRNRSNSTGDEGSESTRLNYGSVVGFGIDELDPENSLAGFLDHVPMSLRRWASYPMLLGRLRRNFKHVMLVDVKEILLLGDPLSRVRTRMSPETVHLFTESTTPNNKHGKKNSAKGESHGKKPANPAAVMGGARGIRRMSTAMLTVIVRATTQHKRKTPVTESVLFNQLVGNEFLLNNVKVVTSAESVNEASSLTGSDSKSGHALSLSNYTVLRRGNSNVDVTSALMKQICSLQVESSVVYSDC